MDIFIIKLMALAVLVLPLFALPFIMKAAGGILERFGVWANDRNRGLLDRSRNWANKKSVESRDYLRDKRQSRRMAKEGKKLNPFVWNARRKARRDYRRKLAKGFASEGEQEYIAKYINDPTQGKDRSEAFARAAGAQGQHLDRAGVAVRASAQASVDKLERESIQNREILIKARYDPRELLRNLETDIQEAIRKGDTSEARAMQNILLGSGAKGKDHLYKALNTLEQSSTAPYDFGTTEVGKALRKDLSVAGLKPTDNALATWSYTSDTLRNITRSRDTYASLKPEELVTQSEDKFVAAAWSGAIDAAKATEMLANQTIAKSLSDSQKAVLNNLVAGVPIRPAPPTPGSSNYTWA